MDRFHLKFIFLSKGWWKVDFKIQKAYSCVSAASAAGVECPPSCPQVVRQSVRLSITTKALLGRGLAAAWLWLGWLCMENQYK